MIIFGIDPGTNITGYGVIRVRNNSVAWVDSGIIKTTNKADLSQKLSEIYDSLAAKMAEHKPHVVCLEQAFYAKNIHTTLILGHARGVAMLAACKANAAIEEYSPREIKKCLVGNGNAGKEQVEYMVKFMLSPPREHLHSDAYDALAVALTGFSMLNVQKIEAQISMSNS
jgi:crossover junction endodeoxyribonuclease RuvC